MKKILVTGAGGIGGVNFIRALRLGEELEREKLFIVGTDYNKYYIHFSDVNIKYNTPKHTDHQFIPKLIDIITKHDIDFLHPHPSVEAKVISTIKNRLEKTGVKTYLPSPESIMPDKLYIYKKMKCANVPVPRTFHIKNKRDIENAFKTIGKPLWIRAVKGAGGKLALKVNSPEEAWLWIKLNSIQKRAKKSDFIIQEYLPGRDIAFDSLWLKGELVTSYLRQRIEYPLKHISLSGITGTPSVAKTIIDKHVTQIGIKAVKALDKIPHGFYSVDIKEDENGNPRITEVDGKWHTTAPLWGYAFSKTLKKPEYNLAYIYLKLGLGEAIPKISKTNLFPESYYLIRNIDTGVLLMTKNKVFRVV